MAGGNLPGSNPRWIDSIKPYAEVAAAVVGILGVGFLVWQIFVLNSQTHCIL